MEKAPIKPIHRRQVSTATIDRILSMISDGYWSPGERLPPQRDLAKSLGVGMSTLREALQSLQTMGVLEMRHGSGTFVSNKPFNEPYEKFIDVSVSLGGLDLEMLFEARGIIESGLAFHAVEHASDEQINELFSILEREMDCIEAKDHECCHDLDLAFHRLIAAMVNNDFLAQIDSTLFKALDQLFRVLPLTKEGWKLHYAVAEAIRDRDAFRASEAMRTLIEASAARYFPYMKITSLSGKT